MTVSESDLKIADKKVKALSYAVDTLRMRLAYCGQQQISSISRDRAKAELDTAVSELDAAKREQARLGKLYFTQRWRTG